MKYKTMKQQLSSDLDALKKHMSLATNVHHWNELREQAKRLFTSRTITLLDASGFINKVIPQSLPQRGIPLKEFLNEKKNKDILQMMNESDDSEFE